MYRAWPRMGGMSGSRPPSLGQAGGIYTAQPGSTVATQYVSDQQFDGIWYVGDLLMATSRPDFARNIISSNGPLDLGPITTRAHLWRSHHTSLLRWYRARRPQRSDRQRQHVLPQQHSQAFIANGGASSGETSVAAVSQNANSTYPAGTDARCWYRLLRPRCGRTRTRPSTSPPWPQAPHRSTCRAMSRTATPDRLSTARPSKRPAPLTIPVQALPPWREGNTAPASTGISTTSSSAQPRGTNVPDDCCLRPDRKRRRPSKPARCSLASTSSRTCHPTRPVPGGEQSFPVYFGWSDYDSASTGIGRCDLSTFIDTQAPALCLGPSW